MSPIPPNDLKLIKSLVEKYKSEYLISAIDSFSFQSPENIITDKSETNLIHEKESEFELDENVLDALDIYDVGNRFSSINNRVTELYNRLPSEHTETTENMTQSVFVDIQEISRMSSQLYQELKIQSPKNFSYDFAMPSYDEFKISELELEREFEKESDELFYPWIPQDGIYILRNGSSDMILEQQQSGTPSSATVSVSRKWIAKIFGALGLKEIWKAILEVFEQYYSKLAKGLGQAIGEKSATKLARMLKLFFKLLGRKKFWKRVARKVGRAAVAKAVGKMAAKCLPFVGWVILIAQIVWAIAEQFI